MAADSSSRLFSRVAVPHIAPQFQRLILLCLQLQSKLGQVAVSWLANLADFLTTPCHISTITIPSRVSLKPPPPPTSSPSLPHERPPRQRPRLHARPFMTPTTCTHSVRFRPPLPLQEHTARPSGRDFRRATMSPDRGHQPLDSIRDGMDAPAATNTTLENTPLLFDRQSPGYTDLDNGVNTTKNRNNPGPSDSNGCRVRHGHGTGEEHGDLDEAYNARQSNPRQEQRLTTTSPQASSAKHRLWDTISKRLVFLQRDESERSPLEKDLVRRLDVFLLTFGCISQGRFGIAH